MLKHQFRLELGVDATSAGELITFGQIVHLSKR